MYVVLMRMVQHDHESKRLWPASLSHNLVQGLPCLEVPFAGIGFLALIHLVRSTGHQSHCLLFPQLQDLSSELTHGRFILSILGRFSEFVDAQLFF